MILVLGTGRSGTSEVARILHEELGVDMGRAHHMGDEFNPRGYYEDREFQSLNISFYMMHLDEIEDETPWKLWREQFQKLIDTKEEPWGVKDPGIADFKPLLNEYLKLNPRIILTTRDKDDTISSLMRFKNKSRAEMERIYNNRMKHIQEILVERDYLEIDCYQEDKDKVLKEWYNHQYASK